MLAHSPPPKRFGPLPLPHCIVICGPSAGLAFDFRAVLNIGMLFSPLVSFLCGQIFSLFEYFYILQITEGDNRLKCSCLPVFVKLFYSSDLISAYYQERCWGGEKRRQKTMAKYRRLERPQSHSSRMFFQGEKRNFP